MSKLDDKFNQAIEDTKECFVVAQAMAKNSFKIGLERDDLLAVCKDVADMCLGEPMNETTLAKAKAAVKETLTD